MAGGAHFDSDDVKVKGIDDATGNDVEINAIQKADGTWALQTKGDSSIVISEDEPVHFTVFLENGGSRLMNVDGSTTTQVFSNGPGSGEIWYVYELRYVISDLKVEGRNKYGDIAGPLTNGLLIESQIDSTDYEVVNMKRNAEIAAVWNYEFSSKSDLALANESALFVGSLTFQNVIVLTGDNSDVIKASVRDDLTGLDEHIMTYKAYRVL